MNKTVERSLLLLNLNFQQLVKRSFLYVSVYTIECSSSKVTDRRRRFNRSYSLYNIDLLNEVWIQPLTF